MHKRLLLATALLLLCLPLAAQDERVDTEGCKDSTLLSRLPGCIIAECDRKQFDEAEVLVGAANAMKALEGDVEKITYDCGENVSLLQIARNAEGALKKAGYTVRYTGKLDDTYPSVTAQKGPVWIYVQTHEPGGGTMQYTQTIVRTKQMEQAMEASADAWAEEINRTGSCSIYGILFDTGKAAIQPESKKCLEEVAKLLTANPTWKMEIGGHTDNVGAKEANQKLSEARAAAVVAWLAANGVDKSRLVARGFGDSAPLADNASEDGRAKNRRVTLKKL